MTKLKLQKIERFKNLEEYIVELKLRDEPDYLFRVAIIQYHGTILSRLRKLKIQKVKTDVSQKLGTNSDEYNKVIDKTEYKLSLLGHEYPEYLI